MSDKNLAYYLSHPDEMPTDTAEIERLSREATDQALESGNEQLTVDKIVGKADEPAPAAANPEDDKPAEVKAEVKPEDQKAEEKPDGILAKDGKNVIPYSQLESARQRASAAESLAAEQAKELETLRAAKDKPVESAESEMLTEEELVALEGDSPTLAKVIRTQQAAIRKLTDTVETVTKTQASQADVAAAEVKSEVQTAIDSNPTLAAWQTAEDRTLWEEAARFDKVLRESPKYANASFEDRFAKVVELTQAAHGVTPARKEEPSLTPEQIKAAAAAKLKEASAGKRPVTLSDIPGGAPPAVDERAKVDDMSPVALGQMFLGMTSEQRDAYLTSL